MLLAMTRAVISTTDAPKAIGPYSQAIDTGTIIYCSGQVGLDPATGDLVPDGVEPETKHAMENIRDVLKAADLGFGNVVKTTIFLADINDFTKVNTIYG